MKTTAYCLLVIALLAIATVFTAGLTGGSYAILGLATAISSKHVPADVVGLVAWTNSVMRICLWIAGVSGLLSAIAASSCPSGKSDRQTDASVC